MLTAESFFVALGLWETLPLLGPGTQPVGVALAANAPITFFTCTAGAPGAGRLTSDDRSVTRGI